MMILNATLFVNFFLKVLYYMRIFKSFGLLVELIYGIRGTLIPFLLFLFFFVAFFTVIFLILGANFGGIHFLNDDFSLFYYVF